MRRRSCSPAGVAAAVARCPPASEHRSDRRAERRRQPRAAQRRSTRPASRHGVRARPGRSRWAADAAFPEEAPASTQSVGEFLDRPHRSHQRAVRRIRGRHGLRDAGRARRAHGGCARCPRGRRLGRVSRRRRRQASASPRHAEYWWRFVPGASWRAPRRSGFVARRAASNIPWCTSPTRMRSPMHSGRGAAYRPKRSSNSRRRRARASGAAGQHAANTWQGLFPTLNDPADGYAGTAPVACYEPNALGLYDLMGNVWEWTASAYYPSHDFAAAATYPEGFDPAQPDEAVAVLKGGSYPVRARLLHALSAAGAHRPEQRAWCVAHRFSHGAESVTTLVRSEVTRRAPPVRRDAVVASTAATKNNESPRCLTSWETSVA